MATTQAFHSDARADQQTPWYIIAGLCVIVGWAYWNTLSDLASGWDNPQYSHGFLVPIFTAVLIAMRRQPFEPVPTAQLWCGVGIVVAGLVLRLVAAFYNLVTPGMFSLIPVLMGVFVIAGGWSALRWSWAPLLFLVFMLPLPSAAERSLMTPLQSVATRMSTYVLQSLGVPDTFNEGNLILIGNGIHLNVEEACSGLRMGTIFLAMAVALTMIIECSWWEKAIVLLSAIPIALVVNMIRIVITAMLFMVLGADSEFAKTFFHDLAGWFMMPIALGFLYAEMQLLSHIFLGEEPRALPQVSGFGPSPAVRRPTPTRAQ